MASNLLYYFIDSTGTFKKMHDLGLNFENTKSLKRVSNILGGGATLPESAQPFTTVLENRVQSDFSESKEMPANTDQNNLQPVAKMSFTQAIDDADTPEVITSGYLDTMPGLERMVANPTLGAENIPLVNGVLSVSQTQKPSALGNPVFEPSPKPKPNVGAPSEGKASENYQPAELTEMFYDVTDELLETPVGTPHIFDLATPVLGTKLNDDGTTAVGSDGDSTTAVGSDGDSTTAVGSDGDSTTAVGSDGDSTSAVGSDGDSTTAVGAVSMQIIPPIAVETGQGIISPVVSFTPIDPDVNQHSQAQKRLAPDIKAHLPNSPVTKNAGTVKSYPKPLENLTSTNALKWLNLQSTQLPTEKSVIPPTDRSVIPNDLDIKNNIIIPKVLPSDPKPKELLDSKPQVFSLKINPETEDNQGQVRAEQKKQKNVVPKTELQANSGKFIRTEAQPQATATFNTSTSFVDLHTTQISATPSSQPTGERFPTPQAALILNMRDAQWGKGLVSQIEKLSRTGEGQIEISLRPKNLGDMHISLEFKGEDTEVRIVTETNAASRILIGAEERLSQMLDAAGFRLSNFSAASDSGFGQGLGQHPKQKQHSAPSSNKNREDGPAATSDRFSESHNGTVNVIA
ncbi:flagellar hook-length control protein FliK [Sulfitobacter sp.]|nr:flagellar hook-length control protein FliK [Sulfitobacter sp.]